MSEDMPVVEKNELVALTAEIVSAFVANNGSFEFRVGYAACGLIRVKSSFPAMRKSTVRMVANRV